MKPVPFTLVLLLDVTNVKPHATVEHNPTIAPLVHPVLLDNPVLLVMMVLQVNLDKLVPLVFHLFSTILAKVDVFHALLDLPAHLAPMDLLVHPALMDNLVPLEALAKMDNPDLLDPLVMLVPLVLPVTQDLLDNLVLLDNVQLQFLDLKVHLAQLDLPDNLVLLVNKLNLVLLAQLVHPALLVILVPLDLMDNLVKLVVLEFLALMPHIVLAHHVLVKLLLVVHLPHKEDIVDVVFKRFTSLPSTTVKFQHHHKSFSSLV